MYQLHAALSTVECRAAPTRGADPVISASWHMVAATCLAVALQQIQNLRNARLGVSVRDVMLSTCSTDFAVPAKVAEVRFHHACSVAARSSLAPQLDARLRCES